MKRVHSSIQNGSETTGMDSHELIISPEWDL